MGHMSHFPNYIVFLSLKVVGILANSVKAEEFYLGLLVYQSTWLCIQYKLGEAYFLYFKTWTIFANLIASVCADIKDK